MTRRLYFEDAYLTRWVTQVKDKLEREEGKFVVLEESAFYPDGGGQPHDTGTLGGIQVLDVISEEDKVLHRVERFPETDQVACEIDWARRFDHMQQHSGQHLLSAVCRDLYDAITMSFHLGADYCTIDVDKPELSPEQLAAIEQEVNRHIYLNHRIVSYFVSAEEAGRLPLVKPPKVTEHVRIVEMEDVEHNGCGGTHVASTGSIGMIKLLKSEKQKGYTRITFKSGYRALTEFQEQQRVLSQLTARLKTGRNELIDRLDRWEEEQKRLQAEVSELKQKEDRHEAKELLTKQENGMIAACYTDKSLTQLQSLASEVVAQGEVMVLLASELENKLVFAHSGSFPVSCGAFFKEHLPAYQGKGGGSNKQAQSGFANTEDLLAFFEHTRQAHSG